VTTTAADLSATTPDVRDWLEARTWRAFDVDGEGRVLAGSDDAGAVQLVELDGDRRTPLTDLPGAVSGRYVPGERLVVVQHDTGGDENAQLSLLRLDPLPQRAARLEDLEPLVRADGVVHRLLDVLPGRVVYATNRRNRVDFDVVVRELASGQEDVVYAGGGNVSEAVVAPDGRRVAVALVSDLAMSERVLLVDGDDVCQVTDPALPGRHERLAWSPDGTALYVTTDAGRDTTVVVRVGVGDDRSGCVVVVAGDPVGDDPLCLSADRTWDVAAWPSPDGGTLLVEQLVDGESRLALHDADGRHRVAVELPGAGTPAAGVVAYHPLPDPVWSPDGRFVALSFSAPGRPGDVLLLDAGTGAVRPLTDSTGSLPAAGTAPATLPTTHRVPAPDGECVPCFVYPGRAGTDVEGSAVLVVHGGPEGQSVRTFNPVVQALASAGHTVLVPNVRGSVGYGRRWYSLDDVRLRLDSVADLAALHAWLPEVGLDPARAALWGGSYGGYMVLAGLTMQPQLWAAGVDIVGISSLVTFLENTSPYRRAAREREYGRLETDREFLAEASPLTHIGSVRAPLVVIHGANDPRVPLSETEQVAAAVRERGLECLTLVYGDEGHGLAKRANRLDAYPQALEFLGRHLRADGPATP
jgi:acetyl esterase/lipase